MNGQTSPACTVRPARPEEAGALSALALRSKASWGYSSAFMRACRAELTYTAGQIASDRFRFAVGEEDGAYVGFYALARLSPEEAELEALFVEPAHRGRGFGRVLMAHARRAAAAWGASRLTIQADPHAARFYRAVGATPCGRRASNSIPGRFLPSFSIDLREAGACSNAASDAP